MTFERRKALPRVQIEEILRDHESDVRKALSHVLSKHAPEIVGDVPQITRELIRAIGRRTNTWTTVRDSTVDAD
jgi:hypothetical protein